MRGADLVPPELHSEPGRFVITLRYKSVFSEADQRWLDGFKPLKLTHDEMLIALLGKDGRPLSPQQIYDSLKLVDWDVYREIIDQAMVKGIVYNTMSILRKDNLRKTRRRSSRSVARLVVRQPVECEKGLSELFGALRGCADATIVDNIFIGQVIASLPPACIYRNANARLSRLLRCLGLSDANRRPTSLLWEIWRGSSQSPTIAVVQTIPTQQSPEPTNTSNAVADRSLPQPQSQLELYVGNVAYSATEEQLRDLFAEWGEVVSCRIPVDYCSGTGRGFGFVAMATRDATFNAMQALHGKEFMGRCLRIGLAEPPRRRWGP
jgi:ATP-dependent DNA helicase RecG